MQQDKKRNDKVNTRYCRKSPAEPMAASGPTQPSSVVPYNNYQSNGYGATVPNGAEPVNGNTSTSYHPPPAAAIQRLCGVKLHLSGGGVCLACGGRMAGPHRLSRHPGADSSARCMLHARWQCTELACQKVQHEAHLHSDGHKCIISEQCVRMPLTACMTGVTH